MQRFVPIEDLFKGRHFDRQIIVLCVSWYTSFKLSLRDLVIMMADRGVSMTHTTILRWVQRYLPEFEKRWRRYARPVGGSWRMDETYSASSMLGSCGASGRTDANVGAVVAGSSYRRPSFMARWGLSAYSHFTFARALPDGTLRESCMRENRTCSLSGGRRPAWPQGLRASSDPTKG